MGRLDTDFFFLKMDWVGDAELKAMGDGREGMASVLDDGVWGVKRWWGRSQEEESPRERRGRLRAVNTARVDQRGAATRRGQII